MRCWRPTKQRDTQLGVDVSPESGVSSKLEIRWLLGCPRRTEAEAAKKSRFSEEQITYALRLAESGTPVVDLCRQIGVSEATYYTASCGV